MASIADIQLNFKTFYLGNTNNDKYHTLYALILLISIPSETSILSKYSIYNIQTLIQK